MWYTFVEVSEMTEKEAMARCPLFEGLRGEALEDAVAYFGGRRAVYRKGDAVVRLGEPMNRFGLVLSGSVQVIRVDAAGQHLIMAEASAGDTFGESLCFLGVEDEPVHVVAAASKTVVLLMRCDALRAPGEDAGQAALRSRFIAMLARRTLAMNRRIQILSKHSLREKLVAFLNYEAERHGARAFTLPFSRTDLSAYLGAHRSSLTRELMQMEAESLLTLDKRHVTLSEDAFPLAERQKEEE